MGEEARFSPPTLNGIRCAAEIIRGCKHGVVLSGAGISTPSGIPDFRSTDGGIWEKYDPFEVASLSSFRYAPEKFFSWMRSLVDIIMQAQPNAAHYAVAALEEQGYVQSIITQNIDGLHQRAGANDVLEVHGSLASLTCVSCYQQYPGEDYIDSYLAFGEIPYCPACGHILKPNLILFGEQLPAKVFLRAQDMSKRCDLMIVAGSSLEVLPVAGLPMRAVESGAHLILINKSKTYLDVRADVVLHEDVVDVLPAIVQAVNQKKR